MDATKISVLHIVVLISFYRFTDASDLQLLSALGYQVVASVLFFGMILIDQLRRRTYGSAASPARTRRELLQTAVAIPTDYGLLCLSFVLLGWPDQFKVVYIVLFVLNAIILMATLLKWWREVRIMDQAEA